MRALCRVTRGSQGRTTRDGLGRPRTPAIQRLVSTREPRSTPVSMPRPVEHEQHVLGGDVAGRALGVGAATEAGDAGVEGDDADLERGVDVADGLRIGVVEMAAHLLDREVAQRPLHRRLHLLRRADADGVGDAAVVDADLLHQPDDMLHLVGADLALVGAAERHRNRGADLDALGLGAFDHRPEALDALGDRAVDVAPS